RRRGGRRVCLGYDGRLSSPALARAAIGGFRDSGVDVLDIGLGPTPMLYYAVHAFEADGGLMVTASHNPPEFNGFKMMVGTDTLYGDGIAELGRIAEAGDFESGQGSIEDRPVLDEYVARVARDYRGERPLTVAWDAGNGAAGEAMARLVTKLPGRHLLLNERIDGTFPNHHPDPTVPENLVQLQDTVRAEGCDLGLAFDGDGDRIGAVDANGGIVWADQLMVLYAAEVLEAAPGATIIADVKASQVLYDEIARLGGTPLMWRTGHSLIKAKLKELGAPLAGEMSGHIFFADRYYGYDDGLYAAVRLLGILSRADTGLAEICARMPAVVNTPELRIPCAEARKFEIVEEVRQRLSEAGAAAGEVIAIDGVRVHTAEGWWLLRASNTQAVLVARCEAADTAGLDRLRQQLGRQLEASGVRLPKF
ncbi:MAG: phosphomannomutase/phosphoglucomutase, partial [Alphaproteobacteria bacterium]